MLHDLEMMQIGISCAMSTMLGVTVMVVVVFVVNHTSRDMQ